MLAPTSANILSSALKEKSFIISDWEASSRYKDDFCAVKKDIEEAIALYEELKDKILLELEKNTKRVYSDEK